MTKRNNMNNSSVSLINVGLKLVPFFIAITIYFTHFIPDNIPSLKSMFIKCAPVICLGLFVIMQKGFNKMNKLSRNIFWGLLFSCGGDALLIWPDCFLYGMVSFAVAQIFYINAYGFRNIRLSIAVPLFAFCFYVLSILMKNASDEFLVGLPIYALLLVTMFWRASARAFPGDQEQRFSWSRASSSMGGLFFLISDAFIGFDRFHSPLPNAQFKIMTTYYLAQFAIALGVLDSTEQNSNAPKHETSKKSDIFDKNK